MHTSHTGKARRLRASLYLRLSREGDSDSTSLITQEKNLRELAERLNADVINVWVDDGFSGSIRQRPDFMNWLNDGRSGTADLLLAWHSDRVSREGAWAVAEMQDVIEGKNRDGQVVHQPVRFASWDDRLDSESETFDLVFGMLAIAARQERKRAVQRSKASHHTVASAGRWHGGQTPFGYRPIKNPDGGGWVLVVDPVEAKAIRKAASDLLLVTPTYPHGKPLNAIAREWAENPTLKPRRAKSWSRASLLVIMTQEALLGRVKVGGVVPRDADGRAFAPFEPILDIDTYEAVRKALEPKPAEHKAPSRLNSSRELSSVLVCDGCDRPMITAKMQHRKYPSYRCQTKATGGFCPAGVTISSRLIELHIEDRFLNEFGDLMVTEKVAIVENHAASDLDDRMAALLARMATSATPEDFAMLQALQAERAALETAPSGTVVTVRETGQSYRDLWLESGKLVRRNMLHDLYGTIRVRPATQKGRKILDPERLVFGCGQQVGVTGPNTN